MKKFTFEFLGRTSAQLKHFTLVLVFLIVAPVGLQAQSVFSIVGIGNGFNTNTGYPAPYGNWYWGSRHQMYVTASELISAGMGAGINVKSVGLNIQSLNSGPPHQNWVVTIYTTTTANPLGAGYVTGVPVSQSTLMTTTGVLGWNQYTVAPFIWNGTDNLVVETCFYNGSYIQNYSTFWTNNLPGTDVKTRAYWQDGVTSCPNSPGSTWTNTRPDLRFEWEYLNPCTGTPGANSVLTPTFPICANVPFGGIGLANSYTVGGLTYQWLQSTTSNVGPFTPVPSGGTGWTYSVPGLTTTTWYQAVITCTNSTLSYTTLGGAMQVAVTTIDTVPYFENFEGIGIPNRLPNCSWWAVNQGTTVLTYTSNQSNNRTANSGTSFGSFSLPSNNNAVYSNGIQMNTGITYSAAIHYATEYFGYNNWTKLEILVGPNQTATGLVQVAQVMPAISGPYKLLSGTFTVPSSGLYYVCFRATGANGNALYLSFDDLSVTIPCEPVYGNNVTLGLSANPTTICVNDQVSLNATGAGAYSWNTGATGANLVVSPINTSTYSVVGTNLLTGCTQTLTQVITVNPTPNVFIVANKTAICPGETVFLTGYGASSFVWSNGSGGTTIGVSPPSNTTYSAIGTNNFGCTGTAAQIITVLTPPTIGAVSSNLGDICAGEPVTLTGNGGASYTWYSSSSSSLFSGNPIVVRPNVSSTYTVVGVGANGCKNTFVVNQSVVPCVGLEKNSGTVSGIVLYPNPAHALFTVEFTAGAYAIELTDIAGRLVLSTSGNSARAEMNISALSNGIYYAKVSTTAGTEIFKVVKE